MQINLKKVRDAQPRLKEKILTPAFGYTTIKSRKHHPLQDKGVLNMKDGFIRICAATPEVRVADCVFNASRIIDLALAAAQEGAKVAVFPELSLTGSTCGDLFLHKTLLDGAERALGTILKATEDRDIVLVVGLPVKKGAALYNCAAVLHKGEILGLIPKVSLPNHGENYEARVFTSGLYVDEDVQLCGQTVALCADQVFACATQPDLVIGCEVGADLWAVEPRSGALAAAGATLIANPSAGSELVGKSAYRKALVQQQSARCVCAYVLAEAGCGESTQDLVFSGQSLIAENGTLLAAGRKFTLGAVYADVDVSLLAGERRRMSTFPKRAEGLLVTEFELEDALLDLKRVVPASPFIPQDAAELEERCEEILQLQVQGLCQRLKHIHGKSAVVGLSGGLDSTLALIVTVHAFDALGLDRKGIVAVTMPCFGTTSRTKNNAMLMAEAYGVTLREVSIAKAVTQHFEDIGQSMDNHDVTFENAQARERTQVLMDIANQCGGIVIGTGDLSELALGWATYNGDHMSMYGVNGSIPKTLVRHLTAFEADRSEGTLRSVLLDVLDTPVSPELLPPKDGEIAQRTEEIVGPYELHDFFLYYLLRYGFGPKKVFRLCKHAMQGRYADETIKAWLRIFMRRFFNQQFKRSCLPDGPKVGSVALSPRGDWRMPSDACSTLWLQECEEL